MSAARECRECGRPFEGRANREHCSPQCRDAFHNRNKRRGAPIVPLLLDWRRGGNDIQPASVQEHVDRWLAEEGDDDA